MTKNAKKPVVVVKAQKIENPIVLSSISIETRLYRNADSEVWVVDGIGLDGKAVANVGRIAIVFPRDPQDPQVCGGINFKYDLALSEEQVWKCLADVFQFSLSVVSADCFFTWRSGTVDAGWE